MKISSAKKNMRRKYYSEPNMKWILLAETNRMAKAILSHYARSPVWPGVLPTSFPSKLGATTRDV